MTGSLQIKNNKYYAVLNIYDERGNRKAKWINTNLSSKGNKREAAKFLQDTIQEYERKAGANKTDMLFSDAIRFWLQSVKHRIDPITYQGYVELAQLHVLPYFDTLGIKLLDLDRRTVQRYIDEKADHGRIDGKGGLSTASLKQHKNILFQTCKEAIINDYLSVNPCQHVILPASERYEYHFYTSDQIAALLDAVKDYIFKWENGVPFSPDYVSHHFGDLLKKHGLHHIRFHELRHSCASMLIVMGFTLKDVQEWLGHSDIKMTANTYSHLDLGRKTEIGDSLVAKFVHSAS